jgi:hypothetical protein
LKTDIDELSEFEELLSEDFLSINSTSKSVGALIVRFDQTGGRTCTSHERSLGSEVFLAVLEEYLLERGSVSKQSIFYSCSTSFLEKRRALCGLFLISLQYSVPSELLLRDGNLINTSLKFQSVIIIIKFDSGYRIISILKAFVKVTASISFNFILMMIPFLPYCHIYTRIFSIMRIN